MKKRRLNFVNYFVLWKGGLSLSGGLLAWLSVWTRWRFAYGPADTTATHLLQEIQIAFTFLVPAHPGSPGQNPESCKMLVVVVVVVVVLGRGAKCCSECVCMSVWMYTNCYWIESYCEYHFSTLDTQVFWWQFSKFCISETMMKLLLFELTDVDSGSKDSFLTML